MPASPIPLRAARARGAMLVLCAGMLLALPLTAAAQSRLHAQATTCSGLGDLGLCSHQGFDLEAPALQALAQQQLNVVDDFGPPFGAGSLDALAIGEARYGQVRVAAEAAMSEWPLGRFVASDILNGPVQATAFFDDQLTALAGGGQVRVRFSAGASALNALPGVTLGGSYSVGVGDQTFEGELGDPQVFTSGWMPLAPGAPLRLFGLVRVDSLVPDAQPPHEHGTGTLSFEGQVLVLGLEIRSPDGLLQIEAASGARYQITLLPVPEPSSAALMVLGVAALPWLMRRRRGGAAAAA